MSKVWKTQQQKTTERNMHSNLLDIKQKIKKTD